MTLNAFKLKEKIYEKGSNSKFQVLTVTFFFCIYKCVINSHSYDLVESHLNENI